MGIDPDRAVDQLDGRVVTTFPKHRGEERHLAAEAVDEPDDAAFGSPELADGYAVVDLDWVAELVRAGGVECVIDTPGGGVAVLLASAPPDEPAWAFPWEVQAGPGRFAWDGPSLASTRDLRVGPDTADRDTTVLARNLGAVTEEQVADLVVTQARHQRLCPVAAEDRAGTDEVGDRSAEPPPERDAGEGPDDKAG